MKIDMDQLNIIVGLVSVIFSVFTALAWLFRHARRHDEYRNHEDDYLTVNEIRRKIDLPPASSGTPMPRCRPPRSPDDAEWDVPPPVDGMTYGEQFTQYVHALRSYQRLGIDCDSAAKALTTLGKQVKHEE